MKTLSYAPDPYEGRIHPYRFNLWVGIASIVMTFAAFTSAYIVARAEAQQIEYFDLPNLLWTNTLVLLVSSLAVQGAVWLIRRGEDVKALAALGFTFLLGVSFLWGQYAVFSDMVEAGHYFVDNRRADDSVSFFYVLLFLHGLHIVASLIVLTVALVKTVRGTFKKSGKVLTYELAATFWHFLGLLWLYLLVFFYLTQT